MDNISRMNNKCEYRHKKGFHRWLLDNIINIESRYCLAEYVKGEKVEVLCPTCKTGLDKIDIHIDYDTEHSLDETDKLRLDNYYSSNQ